MADGPNYEALFLGMQCLKGSNLEDRKHIVQWLRFYKGQDNFSRYTKHYLPQLPKDVAAEFEEEVKGKVVIEDESTDEPTSFASTTVVETKKKRGRLSSK